MNNFSIKDIERLSGIKAHTLRIWEQRHGLCFCKRKESQHRYYDNEDLKHILRIAFLYHNGYKVSRIAKLSVDDIKKLSQGKSGDNNYQLLINQLVEASVDYDQPRFENIVNSTYQQLGFEKSIVNVYYPFFEKIGLLWMTEHILPAHEHFSSYLIQKKIIVAIDELHGTLKSDYRVAIFAPKNEHHEIPLLVMQYLFKKHGIRTVYFGCNSSMADIEYYSRYQPLTHVYGHLITNFLNKEPLEYLNCLKEKFPGKKIILSGPVFGELKFPPEDIMILRSCEEMMQFPKSLTMEVNR
jgi:MerR family transcriptional regulator, light-induced transcriptional regulator